jgi:hypothetical protein
MACRFQLLLSGAQSTVQRPERPQSRGMRCISLQNIERPCGMALLRTAPPLLRPVRCKFAMQSIQGHRGASVDMKKLVGVPWQTRQEHNVVVAFYIERTRRKLPPMNSSTIALVTALALSSTVAFAQSSGGSAGGGATSGAAGSTGAGGPAGTTLSNRSTINGTGGSPGPNTSNALNHGTTGNNLGAKQTNPSAGSSASPSVNTPTADRAVNSLSNTDTGILKK